MASDEKKEEWRGKLEDSGFPLDGIDLQDGGMMKAIFKMLDLKEDGYSEKAQLRSFIKKQQHIQVKQQQKHIFSDGLPEMGPLSETTKFTSNPSVPTEEQHAAAKLRISRFETLSDLGQLPCPKDNIWNRLTEKSHLGGYSNEAGVNKFVERVIMDILDSIGVGGKVTIREEVEVMRNRPDFMLILVNGHPIGTIEGKQPGKDAMEHPNILGEVYDQLLHLHSIFRVDSPFAILTCYEQWRICWLDKPEGICRAALTRLPEPAAFFTPVKPKKKQKQNLVNAAQDMDLEEEKDSPEPLPTPSRAKGPGHLQVVDDVQSAVDDEGLGADDNPRTFFGTKIIEWDDRALPVVLASVIKKMMLARIEGAPAVLRIANETTSAWKRAPAESTLDFGLCISSAVKNFFLWEDLGHGADGRAFLVSGGTKGAVGVLKFFFTDPEVKAQHEESMWKQVYSHLPPVAESVRIVSVMGQKALLMPWFQCPERTQSSLNAVEETLRDDFMNKRYRHDDVAWRNVGVYCDGDQMKAVVFDMQKVHYDENQKEDWVTSAVASLSQKLIH